MQPWNRHASRRRQSSRLSAAFSKPRRRVIIAIGRCERLLRPTAICKRNWMPLPAVSQLKRRKRLLGVRLGRKLTIHGERRR